MKKIVLDTRRNQVLLADTVEQDGDTFIITCAGRKRSVQADKIAYIEDIDVAPRLTKHEDPPSLNMPPAPMVGNVQQQVKLPMSFAAAVERKLKDAPPPDPFDDSPPQDADSRIIVELIGSVSGTYDIMTDKDSYVAEHVKERLVSDIFSNSSLKDALKQHNVVGIVKKGNMVTLDCRQKPAMQPHSVNTSVTNLVNNIVGLVSPSVKLPDLPMQGIQIEDTKK